MGSKVELYTSQCEHWCGDCNKVIPADTPFIYKYKRYISPGGMERIKPYRAHVSCKEQTDGTKSK